MMATPRTLIFAAHTGNESAPAPRLRSPSHGSAYMPNGRDTMPFKSVFATCSSLELRRCFAPLLLLVVVDTGVSRARPAEGHSSKCGSASRGAMCRSRTVSAVLTGATARACIASRDASLPRVLTQTPTLGVCIQNWGSGFR